MTEKRFTYKRRIEFDDTEITDHKTGEKFYGSYIATGKLNKLSEENKQLKQSNKEAVDLINEAIIEALDGARYNVEDLLEKAIELLGGRDKLKGDVA